MKSGFDPATPPREPLSAMKSGFDPAWSIHFAAVKEAREKPNVLFADPAWPTTQDQTYNIAGQVSASALGQFAHANGAKYIVVT